MRRPLIGRLHCNILECPLTPQQWQQRNYSEVRIKTDLITIMSQTYVIAELLHSGCIYYFTVSQSIN